MMPGVMQGEERGRTALLVRDLTHGPGHGLALEQSSVVPVSARVPGPGRSADASTVGLNVGGMQNVPTSVDACPAPSVRLPAGDPVSVIVCAPPPAGPNAPAFRCWQVAYGGAQSESELQACAEPAGAGQPFAAAFGSPSKQPVFSASRQNPQKMLF